MPLLTPDAEQVASCHNSSRPDTQQPTSRGGTWDGQGDGEWQGRRQNAAVPQI